VVYVDVRDMRTGEERTLGLCHRCATKGDATWRRRFEEVA
jgi:hypothetical protein